MIDVAVREAMTAERPRRTPTFSWLTAERAVLLSLWLLLAAVVALNSLGTFMTDIKPEIYLAPGRMTGRYLSAWQSGPTLGVPSFNVGLAPITAVIAFPAQLGVPPEVIFKVWHIFLLSLAAFGARRLYRHLSADCNDTAGAVGRAAIAIAYVANPYVVVAGSTLAILLPYAFLPWLVYALLRALEEPPSWRWPAMFGLCFALMSGANAGVVPMLQLIAVPAVAFVVLARSRVTLRQVVTVLTRCAIFVTCLSLYWIVPSVSAIRAGATVVANSETVQGIADPSSAAEVLRGLGLWPLYGADQNGPWEPQFVSYLTDRVVVLASFSLPVLAFLGAVVARGRVRLMALGFVVLAVPVMVGVHPPENPSPFGMALRWSFDHLPVAGAFRTTNKAGAVLVLGLALLVAEGAARASRRLTGSGTYAAVGAFVALVVLLSAMPAFTGRLYTSPVDIPGYWKQAAKQLDTGPMDRRVWFVPGEVLSHYRWTDARPDDISNSLLDRPALIRTVVPVTSAAGANLLAALDGGLNEATLPPGTLSTASRYLGVSDVLLRNDVVWEDVFGARPSVLQPLVNGDPGLQPDGNFGLPGENTLSPNYPPESFAEAVLPPLQHYRVRNPDDITRAESLNGMLLVDGDGFALPSLVAAGLTTGQPAFRYLGDLDPRGFRNLLGPGRTLVLTDSNRRRTALSNRLADGQGPLLAPGDDAGSTRSLFGPREQTVLSVAGEGTVTASSVGSAFGTIAAAAPENAFDGDLSTSWQFGDFRNAPGESLTLHLNEPRDLGHVSITQASLGTVHLNKVTVRAGGVQRSIRLPDTGPAVVDLTGVRSASLQIDAQSIRGAGFNRVGLAEVSISGVRLTRVARMPERLADLADALGPAGRAALARTPLDVVMARAVGTAASPNDDEEHVLARDFRLPDNRSFDASAIVGIGAQVPDSAIDRADGYDGPVVAESSSRAFNSPDVRASQALDGDRGTAWIPDGSALLQSLSVTAPPQRIDHVDIRQTGAGGSRASTFASRVRIEIDGQVVRDADLGPGLTRVRIPEVVAGRLRLTILDVARKSQADSVRIAEVGFGSARIDKTGSATGCAPVATIDGRPMMMRPERPIHSAAAAPWVGCAGHVELTGGRHALRPDDGWVLDRLNLLDASAHPTVRTATPNVSVHDRRGPAYDITTGPTDSPFVLMLGEGYDARWRATVDGRSMGSPIVLDGYATGWVLPAGKHHIEVRYGPQRWTDLALLVSLTTLLLCLVLFVRERKRSATPREPFVGAVDRLARRKMPVIAGWVLATISSYVLGGAWLAAACAALAVGCLTRRPPSGRALLLAAAALMASVPLIFLISTASMWGRVTATLIVGHPWPHRAAAFALLLLVVGVLRDEAGRSDTLGTDD